MSKKTTTRQSYEDTAHQFADNVSTIAPIASLERFIHMVPPKAKILDVGCGSGRDAKILSERGLQVVGIDFSDNMIKIAKEQAPLAEFHQMDMEALTFPKQSFDGVWAACSLLHLTKQAMPQVLSDIHALLKPEGVFYLTLKKGTGEVFEEDRRYGAHKKFWAYYEEDEIRALLKNALFAVDECVCVDKTVPYQTHLAYRIFCRKN